MPQTYFKKSPLALHATLSIVLSVGALLSATNGIAQSAAPGGDMGKMPMPAGKSMMEPMDMSKPMAKKNEKMSGMSMKGTQDMDFAMMMKKHHEDAIDMAKAELDKGKDATMRAAAKKIIAEQKKEITEFDRWMSKQPSMK